ncbi:unnamed protein product, partial [Symbiodinium necroappetens]
SLEVLEFSWPPAAEDQEERDLGQQPAEDSGIGPSTVVSASPVMLTAEGSWVAASDQERLSALVVDMADHLAEQLAPADLAVEELVCFRQGQAMLFPLASEVLRQSKEWLLGAENFPEDRSGYHTAVSATEAPAQRPKPPKPKRPTVQQLAAQQSQMMQLMTSVVERLDSLQVSASRAPGPAGQAIGPPPPTRAQPPAAPMQVDLEEAAAGALARGELPGESSLTSAVLAQSQALVALVGQLSSGSGDPLLETTGQSASVRGAANRAKLQEELSGRSGAFADKIRANMARRMDPTHLMAEEQISFMRYLERHGAFASQPLLGLLAWQTAQALDLLAAGSEAGARDTLSLLLLMMEQTALDGGNSSLAWLLTLQAEPPQSLFQTPATVPGAQLPVFSALAEQKWVTTALAYAKELDTISVRRAEVGKAVFLGWCPWTLDFFYLGSSHGLPFAPGPDVPCASNASGDVFPLHCSSLREEGEFAFESWIAALPRLLKRGKTQLSGFLVSTFNLPKGTSPDPSAALYPLPLLHERVFQQRACRNASDRRTLAVRRCVHLVAMSLNYMHAGCKHVPLRSLQRPLNSAQARAYHRIEMLVRACAHRAGLVPACSGRRGLHLAARLSEVVCFVERCGLTPGAYPGDGALPEEAPFLPHADHGLEALHPYRDLRADQVALHGEGKWDLAVHLGPDLYMPYVEPQVLHFAGLDAPFPSFAKEQPDHLIEICKLWDASALLGFVPGPLPDRQLTRLFGAYKAPGKLRQIGDRRGQNASEAHLCGPSRFLPSGPLLCRIHVPAGHCLVGSVTDRQDFYTQARISEERLWTNAVGPSLVLGSLLDTTAGQALLAAGWSAGLRARASRLSSPPPSLLVGPRAVVHPTFQSLLQGDAGGVEYATGGHQGLLQNWGCLSSARRLRSRHPVAAVGPWQGLIIDDFFCLGVESGDFLPGSPSASLDALEVAKSAYDSEGVAGSPSKDVLSQRVLKVAGAEIDSCVETVLSGATFLGFPTQKRLSLAAASVRAAECPYISEELVSCLTGSWVSSLMYRRCLMSALDGLFSLGRSEVPSTPGSALRPLSRKIAGELQLLAVLAPVILTNLSAAPASRVFASDASNAKGAFCSAAIGREESLRVWLASESKGHAVRLCEVKSSEAATPGLGDRPVEAEPKKPLACSYDFLEGSASQGDLSEDLGQLGFYVGPVIDPARSRHFCHTAPRLLEWIFFLLSEKRLGRLFAVTCPEGFVKTEPRTCAGNRLALAHLGLLQAALRCVAGLHASETVVSGGLPGAEKVWVLSRGLRLRPTSELVGEDNFSKSALGHLTCAFAEALSGPRPREPDRKRGLENVAVNDLLLAASWRTEACWRWRRNEHINCKEAKAAHRVVSFAAVTEGDSKVSLLLDFSVARGVIGKGRSSSKALRPILLKTGAVAVAGGIHLGLHHAPTRLNVADDPTRDPAVVEDLCAFAGLTPAAAGWFRLTKLNRASLLSRFSDWLGENGHEREAFMLWPAETLAKTLEQYGRELFEAGRPYWHYSETINAISARRPAIRRVLQGAWDLAFSWLATEPYTHHVAMPAVILLALLSVCLTWGWRAEAGIFALAWGGLLRIGEATGAVRSSLVLPRDALWSQAFILLKINEPKTRLRTARHQAAKVEAQDLVELIDLAFAHLPSYSKLWPFSAQTLRKRLDSALEALLVPTSRSCSRPLDLGSFRPGGATFVLQATEDAELVRRRGRWVSAKVMEIYLQEVAASTFYPSLPATTRRRVMDAAACFPEILRKASSWTRDRIPTSVWYNLWSSESSVATGDGDRS